MTDEVHDWIRKAEADWAVAHRLMQSDEPSWDHICFHCQQAAEKWIKVVLRSRNAEFPKVHDLLILASLTGIPIDESCSREDLERLSTLAVEVRYPGFNADRADADHALNAAAGIRQLCRAALGIADQPS